MSKEAEDYLKYLDLEDIIVGLDKDGEFIGVTEIMESYHKQRTQSISEVVRISNMRKALQTVVKGYEGDGMEGMRIRDNIFYNTCKESLEF